MILSRSYVNVTVFAFCASKKHGCNSIPSRTCNSRIYVITIIARRGVVRIFSEVGITTYSETIVNLFGASNAKTDITNLFVHVFNLLLRYGIRATKARANFQGEGQLHRQWRRQGLGQWDIAPRYRFALNFY